MWAWEQFRPKSATPTSSALEAVRSREPRTSPRSCAASYSSARRRLAISARWNVMSSAAVSQLLPSPRPSPDFVQLKERERQIFVHRPIEALR